MAQMSQMTHLGFSVFLDDFFGGVSCYDSNYLIEFLWFPEVLGIVTKFRFCESRIIV